MGIESGRGSAQPPGTSGGFVSHASSSLPCGSGGPRTWKKNRYTSASMGQIRNLTIASVDENAEQLERPGTIGGKRSTHLENCWTFQMTDAGCRSTQLREVTSPWSL